MYYVELKLILQMGRFISVDVPPRLTPVIRLLVMLTLPSLNTMIQTTFPFQTDLQILIYSMKRIP